MDGSESNPARSTPEGARHEPRVDPEHPGDGVEQELVLVKNGQRYVFRCAPGDEPRLLGRLTDLVNDPNIDLDWFDAAVLSHQVGIRIGRNLQRMQPKRA